MSEEENIGIFVLCVYLTSSKVKKHIIAEIV